MTHVDPLEIGSPPGFIPGRFGPDNPGGVAKLASFLPTSIKGGARSGPPFFMPWRRP